MPRDAPARLAPEALTTPGSVVDDGGAAILNFTATGNIRLGKTGGNVGFYGTTPVALQTGVAVTAAAIHAALVNLGLITA